MEVSARRIASPPDHMKSEGANSIGPWVVAVLVCCSLRLQLHSRPGCRRNAAVCRRAHRHACDITHHLTYTAIKSWYCYASPNARVFRYLFRSHVGTHASSLQRFRELVARISSFIELGSRPGVDCRARYEQRTYFHRCKQPQHCQQDKLCAEPRPGLCSCVGLSDQKTRSS